MVNAGAIATASLAPDAHDEERRHFIREGLSRFAGRDLVMDEAVHASEAATNGRNQGIARLLHGYGRMYSDPDDATDIYMRQCSPLVTARALAVMGATLADGGANPVTRERVLDADRCRRVLAVMATVGLYEQSGDWLCEVGLPGKSGVAGGIVTIAPGKGGPGTFSPPLDEAGNGVRGQLRRAADHHGHRHRHVFPGGRRLRHAGRQAGAALRLDDGVPPRRACGGGDHHDRLRLQHPEPPGPRRRPAWRALRHPRHVEGRRC